MNILFLMNTTGIGGTETFTLEICRFLISKGSNCKILNLQKSHLLKRSSDLNNIDYSSLSCNKLTKIHRTIKMVREYNCDIIMGYGVNVSIYLVFIKMVLPLTRIIIGLRGLISWRKGYVIRVLNMAEYISCDLFIANCKAVLSNKLLTSPQITNRSIVINNGIDTNYYRRSGHISGGTQTERVTFVTVANYLPVKGHEFLLDVIRQLGDHLDRIKFIWIGRGPEKLNLKIAIERYGLMDSIILDDYQESVRTALDNADAFILPSRLEGLPRALLEAMSMSLPCIATNVGGNADLIDHEYSGYIVEYGDTTSMRDSIIKLSKSVAIRRKMGIAARKNIIQQYSSKMSLEKYFEVFRAFSNEV